MDHNVTLAASPWSEREWAPATNAVRLSQHEQLHHHELDRGHGLRQRPLPDPHLSGRPWQRVCPTGGRFLRAGPEHLPAQKGLRLSPGAR